ncbi:MAG: patatin-like phospholipase family protein [Rubrivivax sp.]
MPEPDPSMAFGAVQLAAAARVDAFAGDCVADAGRRRSLCAGLAVAASRLAPGLASGLTPGFMLTGCTLATDRNHDSPDAPRAARLPRTPRTAWVFSSGGPRGFVHVGVVKALAELQLLPDLIVGASVGAAVGVLRASGLPARRIEELALGLPAWRLARLAIGADERLSGTAIAELVDEQLQQRAGTALLQGLPMMVVCAVQRLADGAVLGFSQGDAGLAVQASCAIEGQFAPVRIHGQRYADADLRMPLPVRLARALGATRVLAVDASAHEDRAPPGAAGYAASDRRKRELTRPDAALADVLLQPEFGYWASLSREYRERCINAGYRDTMAAAPRLRALHGAGSVPAA